MRASNRTTLLQRYHAKFGFQAHVSGVWTLQKPYWVVLLVFDCKYSYFWVMRSGHLFTRTLHLWEDGTNFIDKRLPEVEEVRPQDI